VVEDHGDPVGEGPALGASPQQGHGSVPFAEPFAVRGSGTGRMPPPAGLAKAAASAGRYNRGRWDFSESRTHG
jgi:hypothetical protein